MELFTGTSGYSYKEWKGSFYPETLPPARMLAYYAGRLPSVEINNTFYRLPKASVLETWASQVPEGFRFAIKASRRITHHKRLKDAGEETGHLLRTLASLGPHLGVVLFQLPPNLRRDLERLDRFADLLPGDTPAAFEFRHPSWRDEAVFERLRARSFAWVDVDADPDPEAGAEDGDPAASELVATARFGYLRLRRAGYDADALDAWARRVTRQGWQRAFVFFKHEDAGAGPRLAADFRAAAERLAARRRPLAARRAAPADGRDAG